MGEHKTFTSEEIDILKKMVGPVTDHNILVMEQNLECFLHPEVSLFITASGYCEYASMPSHTHPSYTFIYYLQPVSDFISEGQHMSYDLVGGKCLSAMSPDVPHQEIEEEYFQSYIAVAVQKEVFERAAVCYGENFHFCGEAFVPRSVFEGCQKELPLYDRFEVDQAISYMNVHLAEKITVDILAKQAGLSSSYFSRIFKTVTGESPIDFLLMLRLQKARIMLINGKGNMTDIALGCGFNSSSYFSACFLEHYQLTPSAYRKKFLRDRNGD